MDVGSVGGVSQVSWKQVAVKQEILQVNGDGELVREAVETIMPTVALAMKMAGPTVGSYLRSPST